MFEGASRLGWLWALIPACLAAMLAAGSASALPPLTAEQIEGFIAVLPEFRALGEKYDAEGAPLGMTSMEGSLRRAQSPFTAALPAMRAHRAYGELQIIVRRHGFVDLSQFTGIADRIVNGFAAVQLEQEAVGMEARLGEAEAKIEASAAPPEQKQQMLLAIEAARQLVESYRQVPEAEKSAIRPYAAAIGRVLQTGGS